MPDASANRITTVYVTGLVTVAWLCSQAVEVLRDRLRVSDADKTTLWLALGVGGLVAAGLVVVLWMVLSFRGALAAWSSSGGSREGAEGHGK